MNEEHARQRAVEYLNQLVPDFAERCAIVDDSTADEGWCWVFFWNSRRFLETGSLDDALSGNAPVVVVKATGSVRVTGTAFPLADYLAEIQARP